MSKNIARCALCILVALFSHISASWAQFNPSNPSEPYMKYKVRVTCEPENVAYCSGAGEYLEGADVWINTSSRNSSYHFTHWTLNGENYSENSSFSYKVQQSDVTFVAHYEFSPVMPPDPNPVYYRTLNLKVEPSQAGSLNYGSSGKYEVGTQVYLYFYNTSGYDFEGWFVNDQKVSADRGYYFTIPDENVTVVAKGKFNPSSPAEPSTFYSTSCPVTIKSEDESKGTVSIEGLEQGRAVFGKTITVSLNKTGGDFCGWYNSYRYMSDRQTYSFVVTDKMKRLDIVARFSNPGDVNNSGSVTLTDMTDLISHLNDKTPTGFNAASADVDGNGMVEDKDVECVACIILGLN